MQKEWRGCKYHDERQKDRDNVKAIVFSCLLVLFYISFSEAFFPIWCNPIALDIIQMQGKFSFCHGFVFASQLSSQKEQHTWFWVPDIQ